MRLYKCYACDGITENIKIAHYENGDFLMCPLCREVEPGFTEIEVEEVKSGAHSEKSQQEEST